MGKAWQQAPLGHDRQVTWIVLAQVNPFEPEIDWFTRDKEISSLSAASEPKRRFMPSKWEEKKCAAPQPPFKPCLAKHLQSSMLKIQPFTIIVAQLYIMGKRVNERVSGPCLHIP